MNIKGQQGHRQKILEQQPVANSPVHVTPPSMQSPEENGFQNQQSQSEYNKKFRHLPLIGMSIIVAMGFIMAIVSGHFSGEYTQYGVLSALITLPALVIWLLANFWTKASHRGKNRRKNDNHLNIARVKAETANQAKSRFLAIASHEMRTPLNGILGMAKLLDETKLSPEQRNYNTAIIESGDALFSFVEELLDFSRIESGHFTLHPQPVDIRQELEKICENLAPLAHKKNLQIASIVQPQVPQMIAIDERRIRQVLVNLLGNAIKFTHQGGVSIRTSIIASKKYPAVLQWTIADTGPGISDADKHRIFEEFEQVDINTTRRFGGAGLGLAISKTIIEKMQGKISLTDNHPCGTKFLVEIPISEKITPLPANNSTTSSHSNILLVMDAEIEASVLNELITQSGSSCRIEKTLPSARKALQHLPAETVLIDEKFLTPPYKSIRKSMQSDNLVVLLTADNRDKLTDYQNMGFTSFLLKPMRQKSLQRVLENRTNFHFPQSQRGVGHMTMNSPAKTLTGRKSKKILLVEDNPINALLAKSVLEKQGHDTELAVNGEISVNMHAAALNQNSPFDLIYMDIHMPQMDGATAMRLIRKQEMKRSAKPVRIVALSADEQEDTRRECELAGANEFLSKPLDPQQLANNAAGEILDKS